MVPHPWSPSLVSTTGISTITNVTSSVDVDAGLLLGVERLPQVEGGTPVARETNSSSAEVGRTKSIQPGYDGVDGLDPRFAGPERMQQGLAPSHGRPPRLADSGRALGVFEFALGPDES